MDTANATTLPGPLGALLLIGVGLGILAVARRGWHLGELPAGSRGLRAYRPRRDDEPAAFYFFFALYVAMGSAAIFHGIAIAVGAAEPLRLR